MKKRFRSLSIFAIVIALAVALSALTACGGNPPPKDDDATNEYGTVSIADCNVFINSDKNYTFAEIEPVFTKPEKAEALTYDYDTKELKIENGVVIPLKRGYKTVKVKASSEHFSTEFNVNVELITLIGENASILYDVSKYGVEERSITCSAATSNTTLLLGNSFMDDYFIGEYMSEYKVGKDIINAGISSTTSYHWEAAYKKIIGNNAPKNVALHIGTNNFYDAHDSVKDTEQSLMRLFMMMHNSYPLTKIYWFDITQRTDTRYAAQVSEVNTFMQTWCDKYEWITCVDTCSQVSGGMLRDGVHPKTEHYKVFTDALVAAGCDIAVK